MEALMGLAFTLIGVTYPQSYPQRWRSKNKRLSIKGLGHQTKVNSTVWWRTLLITRPKAKNSAQKG
jgi:hypothetical protein